MLRKDGKEIFYQIVDRSDTYNDGEWFVRDLDRLVVNIPKKHRYVLGKKASHANGWEEVPCIRAFTACGSWQRLGYFAAEKRKHAIKFLKLLKKYNSDVPNLAIRKVVLNQKTTILPES